MCGIWSEGFCHIWSAMERIGNVRERRRGMDIWGSAHHEALDANEKVLQRGVGGSALSKPGKLENMRRSNYRY